MHVAEALGVEGLGREELSLGPEGRILVRIAQDGRAAREETIADHPCHRCSLEGGQVPIRDVASVEVVAAAAAAGAGVGCVDGLQRKQHARKFLFRIRAVRGKLRMLLLLLLLGLSLLRMGAHGRDDR